jgi:hypothetical protein
VNDDAGEAGKDGGRLLWVSDLNGDFLGGKRELPDGFIVEISAASEQ